MFLVVRCQHASGMCQSHSHPVLSLREASRNSRNFLRVLRPFWHSVSTRKICRQLRGYSKFGRYSLHSGIFFQSPQGHLGDMGQSDDLVSLLFWEVIVDVMDNSNYKFVVFGATSSLGQKVC
jgi:hypothetical protein